MSIAFAIHMREPEYVGVNHGNCVYFWFQSNIPAPKVNRNVGELLSGIKEKIVEIFARHRINSILWFHFIIRLK